MNQINLSQTLAAGASYYAGVGGIVADGSVTQAEIDAQMVDAYNDAYALVLETSYYTTQMMLEDQHDVAMDNLSAAIDNLVDATLVFATVGAVADMAEDAAGGSPEEQIEAQQILEAVDMTIEQADVDNYNEAVGQVEQYAQEAAAYLSASLNTGITSVTDQWASSNNVTVAAYTSVTYDATQDLLWMNFMNDSGQAMSAGFQGYLQQNFKTAEEVYGAGVYYGG